MSNQQPDELKSLDVDDEFDQARPLLIEVALIARDASGVPRQWTRGGRILGPGSDLVGAKLAKTDFRGLTLLLTPTENGASNAN